MLQISISNAIGSRGNGGAPSLAPVNTVAPVISGTSVVGYTLSSTTGTWTGTLPITYTYQWYRGASPIISATSSSYTLVNADDGQSITCQVTATNIAGSSTTPSNAILVASLLLDLYPNSSVAYSLRKLRTAYSGSAVRVRRSNDNAEQDIAFVGNELDTQTMLDFVGYNLWNYSEDISQTVYGVSGSTKSSDVETAPDGTLTGDKVVENTSFSEHGLNRVSGTILNATSYTTSAYFKQGERTKIKIYSNISGATQNCDLDLTNGNISNNGFANTPTVTAEANGWYRFSVTITSGATSATNGMTFRLFNASNAITYTGDGTSGVYVWGYQLSQTSTVKTYQKTVATAGGSGFISEWYDQSGNGLNVSQGTALNQPRIVNAGVLDTKGNKAAIFSVSSDLLTRASLAFGNYPFNLSVFSVSYNEVSLGNASVFSTNTPLAGAGIQHYCDRRAVKRNTILYGATVVNTYDLSVQRDNSNQRLLSLFMNASTNAASAFDNGNAGTTGTVTGGTHTETAFNVLGTTSSGVQELIIYKADNSANRTAIESNINTYYSIY